MNVIYTPSGRAREYSKYALNLYNGCEHGCVYCYVPKIVRRTYKDFTTNVSKRMNVIQQLTKDLTKYSEALKDDGVLLCFTCDPYQPREEVESLTRACLKLFDGFGVPVEVLTKGCKLAMRDFDILVNNKNNKYAVTLTHTSNEFLAKLEPKASTFDDRVHSLEVAKKAGITTWVSLEPVISFEETYEIIRRTHSVVDQFRVGKLNHDTYEKQLDWRVFKREVVALLDEHNCNYFLKKDLAEL
jgi:DNA repair photolyase